MSESTPKPDRSVDAADNADASDVGNSATVADTANSAPVTERTRRATASALSVERRTPTRVTLSLASHKDHSARRGNTAAVVSSKAALGAAHGVVPLKQLTAGRKALKIAHAGETYLLQVTKANRLILTKPKEAPAGQAGAKAGQKI